jgi:hypothetical protein
LEKKGSRGGFWPNGLLLPPWFAAGQRQGRLGRRRPAGLPATAAASERGNRERATRGFPSLTHLGLGRAVEAAPREGSGVAAVLGGRRRCGARGKGKRSLWRCEAGSGEVRRPGEQPAPFIGGGRRFGGEDFSGEADSGELERLLEAAPGDKTARAAAGLLVQVARRGACGGGAGLTARSGGGAWR